MTAGYEDHIEHPPLEAGKLLGPGYEIVGHLHQSNGFDVWSEERACRCIAKTPGQTISPGARRCDAASSAKAGF